MHLLVPGTVLGKAAGIWTQSTRERIRAPVGREQRKLPAGAGN